MLLCRTVLGFPSCDCPFTSFSLTLTFLLKLLICGALVERFWLQSWGLYSDLPHLDFLPVSATSSHPPPEPLAFFVSCHWLSKCIYLYPPNFCTWDSVGSWGPFPLLFLASALFLSWCQPYPTGNSSCHARLPWSLSRHHPCFTCIMSFNPHSNSMKQICWSFLLYR